MTFLQSIILGIIQGLTEFLPISSSAHLVLIPHLLGWDLNDEFVFPFNVLVQAGTLVAVIVYYRQDLLEIITSVVKGIRNRRLFEEEPARIGWLAVLATIPAGLIGFLFKDQVEAAFSSPSLTAVFLFLTAGLLILAEFAGKKTRELGELRWLDALWIGFFQVLSIFPGVSRSGSTITGGMTRNFDRKPAGQFAFLLAIPILAAAGLLGLLDLFELENLTDYLPLMAVGFIVSGMVGYLAIRWLIAYISNNSLLPFAGYCLILGAGSLLLFGLPEPTQAPTTAALMPEPSEVETYQVSIEPDLEWLLPAMNACQQEADNLDILFGQEAVSDSSVLTDDVFIAYGEIQNLSDSVFQIGSDSLALASHPSLSLEDASSDLAAMIFSSNQKTWAEVREYCVECFSSASQSGDIVLFVYPSETRLRQATVELLPAGFHFASTALIAPGARQVRESLSADPNAVGFLPRKWLNSSVKEIHLTGTVGSTPQIPILAYTANHFDETLADWLICVQNRIG
jgi:undecaprenyl-diphosphatase